MKRDFIFLKPVFKRMIWGGTRLAEFGYSIPGDDTGECWAISAHKNGDCEIASGEYAGLRLSELWSSHRELFGDAAGDVFPLLIKIIDANDDLSIQVHPDDAYAAVNEGGSLGKTECWYILDCKAGASIVIGHNAKDKRELADMINSGKWGELIREVPIKRGDFFQIEPGCLHAIKAGTLILETQQSSDITYRAYDYGRLQGGKPRELHIEKSIDVITAPFVPDNAERIVTELDNMVREQLVKCKFYTVELLRVSGECELELPSGFVNVSIISGCGSIDGTAVKKGDHFIIPASYGKASIDGVFSAVISYI